MSEEDIETIRQEVGRVNVRLDILERTLLPLIGGLLSDSLRGETLQDRVAYIQNIRHRVQASSKASVDETEHQAKIRRICCQQIDALFDQIIGSLADEEFGIG